MTAAGKRDHDNNIAVGKNAIQITNMNKKIALNFNTGS